MPPAVLRALRWTRLQGALLDIAAGALAGLLLGWPGAGALLGALLALRWTEMRAARAIERRRPALGSALQAFLEGQGGSLRAQLSGWVAERTGPVFLRAGFFRLLALSALAAAAPTLLRDHPRLAAPARASLGVRTRVEPPAYSGQPAVEVEGPLVRALRGSRLRVEARSTQPVLFAEEGAVPRPLRGPIELLLDRTRALRLSSGDAVLLLRLEAVADRPPDVALLEPEADRTVHAAPAAFPVRASARDDLAVASLTVHWTLAQGRGEGMHFRNGRVATTGDTAEAAGLLDPGALGMRQGDTLVVWAEAADGNIVDGPGRSRSPARILRWEEKVVEMKGLHRGAPLPPPSSLLTEREILARTERLVRSRRALRERSAELAADQRKLRISFGFFLQAETGGSQPLDVDDKELAESGDARARRLLAQAVSFMWEAESALSIGNPAAALKPERAAVKALDAAFGLVRLSLRPGGALDKPVDESRRLRGDQRRLRPLAPPAVEEKRPEAVAALARTLLLASQRELSAGEARALGDAVWALPVAELSQLAAPLYAAPDAAARAAGARAAGEALARWARPSPIALPPADGAQVLAHLPQ